MRQFAHTMINSGAQLVIGSGPHVVRGMEVYCGRLIAYSLGNFATYGSFNLSGPNGLSLILEVHLAKDGSFQGGKIYPIKQEKPGGPQLDATNSILPILRDLSTVDFPSTHVDITPEGELAASSTASASCEIERNYSDRTLQPARCGAFYYHPCSDVLICRP